MIYDTIITGVASKVVTTKAGKTMTLYLVTDSQGTEWTTGRRDLGNEANNMIGRAVQIQGEVKQNGNFTNHYLEDIRAVGESPTSYATPPTQFAPPPSAHVPMPPPVTAPPPPPIPPAPSIPPPAQIAPQGPTEKDWMIFRQTACKVAAHISESPQIYWENVDKLITYFAYGLKPNLPAATGNGGNQFIPEEAIAEIAAEPATTGYPYGDSDIPF